MKTLAIVLGIAVAMVTVPGWAADYGSLQAMTKVTTATSLTGDELSAVEGGAVVFGDSVILQVHEHSLGTFLGYVLQQQYGVGNYPPIVVNTTIQATASGSGVHFEPIHTISPLTLACQHCIMP